MYTLQFYGFCKYHRFHFRLKVNVAKLPEKNLKHKQSHLLVYS